jgi:arabinogalactan endo-1,4-beta-galactosidase
MMRCGSRSTFKVTALNHGRVIPFFFIALITLYACDSKKINEAGNNDNHGPAENDSLHHYYTVDEFVMGADLSYVNEVLDHGGVYRDSGSVTDPYQIFADYGTNVVRLRIWHNPEITMQVYGASGTELYNDLLDAAKSIAKVKALGMSAAVDFHYSDYWADAGWQEIPKAWKAIRDIGVLRDSVYQYTKKSLLYLNQNGLMPEMVQIGNEINCGMLYSNAPSGFPALNACNGNWKNLGSVINKAVQAVREVSESSDIKTRIILHIAQPENVEWWFDNITTAGGVTDFDIVGFSYYDLWSRVPLVDISTQVARFRVKFSRDVMIMETAYPWTMENADSYANIFGTSSLVQGYPATPEGQKDYLIELTQKVIAGGGTGIFYWEPAWITSQLKDKWGTGSSWENNAFFDFNGNALPAFDFMTYKYDFGN